MTSMIQHSNAICYNHEPTFVIFDDELYLRCINCTEMMQIPPSWMTLPLKNFVSSQWLKVLPKISR